MDTCIESIKKILDFNSVSNSDFLMMIINTLILIVAVSGVFFSIKNIKFANKSLEVAEKSFMKSFESLEIMSNQLIDSSKPVLRFDIKKISYIFDFSEQEYSALTPNLKLYNIGKGAVIKMRIELLLSDNSDFKQVIGTYDELGIQPGGHVALPTGNFVMTFYKIANSDMFREINRSLLKVNISYQDIHQKDYSTTLSYKIETEEYDNIEYSDFESERIIDFIYQEQVNV